MTSRAVKAVKRMVEDCQRRGQPGVLPQMAVQVSEGEPGNVSDAFIGTIRSLRALGNSDHLVVDEAKSFEPFGASTTGILADVNAHFTVEVAVASGAYLRGMPGAADASAPAAAAGGAGAGLGAIPLQRTVSEPVQRRHRSGMGSQQWGTPPEGELSLEPVQAEAWLHEHLMFCMTCCKSAFGQQHVSEPTTLASVLPLLEHGSPRVQRLLLQLLSMAAATRALKPTKVVQALPDTAGGSLAGWLLGLLGRAVTLGEEVGGPEDRHPLADPAPAVDFDRPNCEHFFSPGGFSAGHARAAYGQAFTQFIWAIARNSEFHATLIPYA